MIEENNSEDINAVIEAAEPSPPASTRRDDDNSALSSEDLSSGNSGGVKKGRRPLGILLLIALIGAAVAVLCVTLFLPQKDASGVLKYGELESRDIESIAQYNTDNNANFKYLLLNSSDITDAAAYSDGESDVMVTERIALNGANEYVMLYALNKMTRIDILDEFFSEGYETIKINEINVTFLIKSDNGVFTTRFACIIGENAYYAECVSAESGKWTELARQLTA